MKAIAPRFLATLKASLFPTNSASSSRFASFASLTTKVCPLHREVFVCNDDELQLRTSNKAILISRKKPVKVTSVCFFFIDANLWVLKLYWGHHLELSFKNIYNLCFSSMKVLFKLPYFTWKPIKTRPNWIIFLKIKRKYSYKMFSIICSCSVWVQP